MSEHEKIVTIDELRKLVKDEDIRPEKIFDEAALKHIRDTAEAKGYAAGKLAAEAARKEADDGGIPDHLNPAKNPWIKTE